MEGLVNNQKFFPANLTAVLNAGSGTTNNKIRDNGNTELKEACQGFEAIFIQSMIKSMRSTLPGDDFFGGGQGMDIYTSMHDQYLAEKISRGENGTGIGEYLYRELTRL